MKHKDNVLSALDKCIQSAQAKNPNIIPSLKKARQKRLLELKDAHESTLTSEELEQLLHELGVE